MADPAESQTGPIPPKDEEGKRLLGVVSAIAGRPLSVDEFGLVLHRALLIEQRLDWFEQPNLNRLFAVWEFKADAYPVGSSLPTIRSSVPLVVT